jgi:hypothetical protein
MPSYFYIIKFTLTNQYYAGSRYTKRLNENSIKNDLWHRYFTSSKLIKMLIKKFSKESFVIRKVKFFSDHDSAKIYETRFLKRINAKQNPKILNQSNSVFENAPELQWITDGIVSTMIPKGKPLIPGFRLGRTQNPKKISKSRGPKNKTHAVDIETNNRIMIPKNEFDPSKHNKPNLAYNKNGFWIYNPSTNESKIIKDLTKMPPDWKKGNPRRKSSIWYHDPTTQINYQIKDGESLPSNLKKGRFYPFAWYTNPLTNENILCKISDNPPFGFIKGRNLSIKKHG